MHDKWEKRYLELAHSVADWSKDPGTHVGAVVVGAHGQILSTGYNGFPRGVNDSPERLNDRDTKLKFTIHAEMNCIFNASLSGISLAGSTMYVSGLPTCCECAKGVIQSGISKLVIDKGQLTLSPVWYESWKTSRTMLSEAGVKVYVIGDEAPTSDVVTLEDEIGEDDFDSYEEAHRHWKTVRG